METNLTLGDEKARWRLANVGESRTLPEARSKILYRAKTARKIPLLPGQRPSLQKTPMVETELQPEEKTSKMSLRGVRQKYWQVTGPPGGGSPRQTNVRSWSIQLGKEDMIQRCHHSTAESARGRGKQTENKTGLPSPFGSFASSQPAQLAAQAEVRWAWANLPQTRPASTRSAPCQQECAAHAETPTLKSSLGSASAIRPARERACRDGFVAGDGWKDEDGRLWLPRQG
jgi:hypothetical protein